MKKVFVLLFIAFSFMESHAQEHLTFKGVPIDGTLDVYVEKMKKAGFSYIGNDDGIALLQGEFAGFRNCTIGVITLESIDVVNRISVLFESQENWANLYGNYSLLKEMLTKKYGKHDECVEKFDTYSEPSDDGDRMHHLRMDRCKYCTGWETEKGTIELDIIKGGILDGGGMVRLSYWDKINTELVQNKALDDL